MLFSGGGGRGCRCIPPGVRRARPSCGVGHARGSFRLRSVCPASCQFRISFAFDAVGLGIGPLCFRVDSEEALQKRTDERALLARAALGATPEMKLVTRSWIVGEGEYTNGVENIKYAPQLTASIWMPFEQSCDEESGDADFDAAAPWDDGETRRDDRHEVWYWPGVHGEPACGEESGDADFDSFKTAPWDAGGTKRDETYGVWGRPMIHDVDGLTTGNTKFELTTERLVDTNCPRLESTPGEGDASYRSIDDTYEVRCRSMIHNVDGLMTGNTRCELTTERLVDTNCPRLESTPGEGDASYRSIDETYEVRCRPMIHNVDILMTGNTECELTAERSGDTNCPRLESTPGEGDASYRSTDWSVEGHTSGRTFSVSDMICLSCAVALLPTDKLYATIQPNDTPVCIEIDSPADINDAVIVMDDEPILRRRLPRTEVFAEGVEEKCMAPCTHSMQNSQIFRRANPWRRVVSTEKDMHGNTVKGVNTVFEPCDLLCHQRSLPPNRAETGGGGGGVALQYLRT